MVGHFRARCSGIALAALCVAALAGCGGSQDETVRDLARHFHDALAAGDGDAACEVLAPTTRDELEQSSGQDCRQAVLEQRIPAVVGAGDVAVFDTMAQLRYAKDTVFLTRMPDGWRVLAAACTPRPVGPHDCKVKGG